MYTDVICNLRYIESSTSTSLNRGESETAQKYPVDEKAPHYILSTGSLIEPLHYNYSRLEASDAFRILELLPSSDPNNRIRCHLHSTTLGKPSCPYAAVSYAWGSRDVPQAVVDCNGYLAWIPPTLYSALRRLQETSGKSQFLWVDALCIDQARNDDARSEKSRQVKMMDQIFASAEKVIVDLGEIEDDALDVLSHLDRYRSISAEYWSFLLASSGFEQLFRRLKGVDVPTKLSNLWAALPRFCNRPWFTRVWIIQEFALAQKVEFMLGKQIRDEYFLRDSLVRAGLHLSWLYAHNRTYPSAEGILPQLEESLFEVAAPLQAMQHLVELRYRENNARTFCEQLSSSTALFHATDTRDKAYALLGLSSDEGIKENFAVNYNETLPNLAIRVSMYLRRSGLGVYPLYRCVGDKSGYVSWALNLEDTARDELDQLSQLMHWSGHTRPRVFQACVNAGTFVSKFSDLIAPGGLTVRGVLADTIDCTMEDGLLPAGKLKSPAHLREQNFWLDAAYEWMVHAYASHCSSERISEDDFVKQCWRTVIADLVTGTGQEGRGITRLRDWTHADRCIDAWTACHRLNYRKQHGDLSESFWTQLSHDELSDIRVYGESIKFALGRRLALTRDRRGSCLIPQDARVGDLVAVIQGCEIPFILRQSTTDAFRIVGCAYIHGLMDGEAVSSDAEFRDFEIC